MEIEIISTDRVILQEENPNMFSLGKVGYKETNCMVLSNGNMIMSNRDIIVDENIEFALKLAKIFERNHKVDLLLKKFSSIT